MQRFVVLIALLIVGTVLLAACAGDDDSAAPPEPTPVEPVPEPADPAPAPAEPAPSPAEPASNPDGAAELTISFDGESCERADDGKIDAGVYRISFDNQSDSDAFLGFAPVAAGFTAEEVLASQGETSPGSIDAPLDDWIDGENNVVNLVVVSDPGSTAEGSADFGSGEYVFSCGGEIDETGEAWTWFTGGGLSVESDAAELTFAFDGETCEYRGPETIAAGTYTVLLDNQSDEFSFLGLAPVVEGITAEEVTAAREESGTATSLNDPPLAWIDHTNPVANHLVMSEAGTAESAVLEGGGPPTFSPGLYGTGCGRDVDQDAGTWHWVYGDFLVVE